MKETSRDDFTEEKTGAESKTKEKKRKMKQKRKEKDMYCKEHMSF